MSQLKRISPAGIEAALAKAERYRLLNEAWAAESICLDVLASDPGNESALIQLALARSDQFGDEVSSDYERAREPLERVTDAYKRAYYGGILCERRARAKLESKVAGRADMAWDWLHRAMALFAEAEQLRAPGNDEALLRWNTCVRLIQRHQLTPPEPEAVESVFGE
jgi:tetratricopeptide (TPR) repeat protein